MHLADVMLGSLRPQYTDGDVLGDLGEPVSLLHGLPDPVAPSGEPPATDAAPIPPAGPAPQAPADEPETGATGLGPDGSLSE